jgi:phosphoserine phosphatase
VNRILALYPDRNTYHLTAYGDSRGDKELLAFADESHYQAL